MMAFSSSVVRSGAKLLANAVTTLPVAQAAAGPLGAPRSRACALPSVAQKSRVWSGSARWTSSCADHLVDELVPAENVGLHDEPI